MNGYLQKTENVRKYAFIFMWAVILFSALRTIGGIIKVFVLGKYDSQIEIEFIESIDAILISLVGLFNMPWFLMLLLFLVTYSMWIYQAYANLVRKNVSGLKRSPAWAVGWSFMPLAQFFMPYVVMKEIWLATFFAEEQSEDWKRNTTPNIFIVWWVTFIIGWLTWLDLFQFGGTVSSFKIDAWLTVISGICFVISGLVLQKVMKQITNEQSNRFQEAA